MWGWSATRSRKGLVSSSAVWRRAGSAGPEDGEYPQEKGRGERGCRPSAIGRRRAGRLLLPRADTPLAFWRTRWRWSAQAGVLAHRLASASATERSGETPDQRRRINFPPGTRARVAERVSARRAVRSAQKKDMPGLKTEHVGTFRPLRVIAWPPRQTTRAGHAPPGGNAAGVGRPHGRTQVTKGPSLALVGGPFFLPSD